MSSSKQCLISDRVSVSLSDRILFQEIDNELIILNMKDENYIGLDEIGTNFWNILVNSKSTLIAYKILLEEYEVIPETLKEDLEQFIDELISNGLISLSKVN